MDINESAIQQQAIEWKWNIFTKRRLLLRPNDLAKKRPLYDEEQSQRRTLRRNHGNPFSKLRARRSTFSLTLNGFLLKRRRFYEGRSRERFGCIEEWLLFEYDYHSQSRTPIRLVNQGVATAPWNAKNKIVQIDFKKKSFARQVPPSNMVFLMSFRLMNFF